MPSARFRAALRPRAARNAVSYDITTDVDDPKQLSMDDALKFRALRREKEEGGAVHAAASRRFSNSPRRRLRSKNSFVSSSRDNGTNFSLNTAFRSANREAMAP